MEMVLLFNIAKIKKQIFTCEHCFNVVQGLLPCDHIFSFQSHLHATQCYKVFEVEELKCVVLQTHV